MSEQEKKPKEMLNLATALIEIGSFNKARKLLDEMISQNPSEDLCKKGREKQNIIKNDPIKYWAFAGTLFLLSLLYVYYTFIKEF